MHSVTKVLMAFAAVLSIFLSAMVIAYAANTDRILQDFGNAQAAAAAADARYQAGTSQWSTERGTILGERDKLLLLGQQKDQQLAELELERAALRNERAEAQRARDSFKAQVDEFASIIKTNQTIIDRYSQEVSELRRSELAFRTRELETEERLANLLSQVEVQEANLRVAGEQLFALQQQLSSGGTSRVNTGQIEPFQSNRQITGKVDNVQADRATGRTLVQINVGTNNGVSNGMIFRVVRGDQFIANVVVSRADLSFSIAEVNVGSKDIQVGDEIRTRLPGS